MIPSIESIQVNLQDVIDLIAAGVLIQLLYQFAKSIKPSGDRSSKAIITTVAAMNGLLISLDVTPYVDITIELVGLSSAFTPRVTHFVRAFINFGTFVEIVFGGYFIAKKGGQFGIMAFVIAFVGGYILPVLRGYGTLLIFISVFSSPFFTASGENF